MCESIEKNFVRWEDEIDFIIGIFDLEDGIIAFGSIGFHRLSERIVLDDA